MSKAYSAAGVDTGSIAVRGGTHYEFSWIADPAFGATLRGADLTTWYTTAWFDAYLKGDPTAFRRLRTDRWRDRRAVGRRRPRRRRQHDVALLPLAAGHRPRRRALRVRGPARRLPGPARRRRRAARLRLPLDRDHAGLRPGGGRAPARRAGVRCRGGRPGRVGAAAGQRAALRACRGRTTVEVFRQTLARADHAPAARRALPARARATSPGTAGRRVPRPPRVRRRASTPRASARRVGAVKHVALLRRAHGRFARRGTFRTLAGCGMIRDASLARPVFGGRAAQAARHPASGSTRPRAPRSSSGAATAPSAASAARAAPGRPHVQAPPAVERDPPRSLTA